MVNAEGRSASSWSADELWSVLQLRTSTVRNTNIQQVWVQACTWSKVWAKPRLLSAYKLILWKQWHKQQRGYLSYVAVDGSTEIRGFRQKTAANVKEITSDVISGPKYLRQMHLTSLFAHCWPYNGHIYFLVIRIRSFFHDYFQQGFF